MKTTSKGKERLAKLIEWSSKEECSHYAEPLSGVTSTGVQQVPPPTFENLKALVAEMNKKFPVPEFESDMDYIKFWKYATEKFNLDADELAAIGLEVYVQFAEWAPEDGYYKINLEKEKKSMLHPWNKFKKVIIVNPNAIKEN